MNQCATLSGDNEYESASSWRGYTLKEWVGHGTYGNVRVAVKEGNSFAAKFIRHDQFNNDDVVISNINLIRREVVLLANLNHDNIIKIVDLEWGTGYICIITRAMHTTLLKVISSEQHLNDDHHRRIMSQVVYAVAHLHRNGIMHRDLKPANILINEDCFLKICDLGLARYFVANRCYTTEVVTLWYRAPELLEMNVSGQSYGEYTPAVDVWAMGCIFMELLMRKPLYPEQTELSMLNDQIMYKDEQKMRLELLLIQKGITENHVVDFAASMLTVDWTYRISAEECTQHPYISLVAKSTNLHTHEDTKIWEDVAIKTNNGLVSFCQDIKNNLRKNDVTDNHLPTYSSSSEGYISTLIEYTRNYTTKRFSKYPIPF